MGAGSRSTDKELSKWAGRSCVVAIFTSGNGGTDWRRADLVLLPGPSVY